jgi:hypothetical protein
LRIEESQRGHAERAGADRGDGHQHADTAPTVTVDRPHGRCKSRRWRTAFRNPAGAAEEQRERGQQQGKAEHHRDQPRRAVALNSESGQQQQRQRGGRNAAQRQAAGDRPVDVAVTVMDPGTAALGDGRVKQVSAHCGRRLEAEKQNQQRRHQRAAADAGQADEEADDKAGQREQGIEREFHDAVHRSCVI